MEETTSPRSSSMLYGCLINHVALPPCLPGKQEENIIQIEHELLVRLQDAARVLQDQSNAGLGDIWDRVHYILEICKTANARRKLDKARLLAEFRKLQRHRPLILHVTEQNAGLLVWRQRCGLDEVVVFECFEAAASSEKVLASENALSWDFPGEAVAIPYEKFDNTQFQRSLAGFLEQASTESVKRFTARATKAGSSTIEFRDTVNPALVTQMFMTLLEANGSRVFPPLLRKRIRDDVCWAAGGEKPWRRSAFWLILRVGIERYLCSGYDDGITRIENETTLKMQNREVGRVYYKFLLCVLISRLIDDSLGQIASESLALLRSKLARRLSKLQMEQSESLPHVQAISEQLFASVSARFHRSIQASVTHLENIWSEVKISTRRLIPNLPRRATRQSCTLSLRKSAQYLENVMSYHQQSIRFAKYNQQTKPSTMIEAPCENHFRVFAERYYRLSELEASNDKLCIAGPENESLQNRRCLQLAARIEEYLEKVSCAYDNSPEQKSIMILSTIRLWVALDQCTTKLFNLLEDFHPGITPDTLDILQLPLFSDMVHLQNVQVYLRARCDNASSRTIFDAPAAGCFAERYYDESVDSRKLQDLHLRIEAKARIDLQKKETEWQRLSAEFEELERSIARSNCVFKSNESGAITHDDKLCRKCYLQRRSRRMRIQIHEHPLPTKFPEAKAVIFELACPSSFKAYRNATWRLLRTLGLPDQPHLPTPKLLLDDYSGLKRYGNRGSDGVCLASTTKPFLKTHYKGMRFPLTLDAVCLPNGLRLTYFDTLSNIWISRQFQSLNLSHHFRMNLHSASAFSSVGLSVGSSFPSSYEVIASQTRCPPRLNVHEFMAYKGLFSGNSRRWPSILVELGSANLNLSTEATTLLISQLAIQAGPADEGTFLRVAHKIFEDVSFCRQLIGQVSQRLDNIASNWRETNCMDMLLTLLLRLCSIAPHSIYKESLSVILKVRSFTSQWIVQLRHEIYQSTDAAAAERFAVYAFWAALLCRRTFSVHIDGIETNTIGVDDLQCFIDASITMQDNAPSDFSQLPSLTKNALIRDLKMVYRMRSLFRESLAKAPRAFYQAMDSLWPQAEGTAPRCYANFEILDPSHEWVSLTVSPTQNARQQTIHYHLLEGHLIVDGQPLGKLPAKHRKSVVLEQLFGEQRLLIYPSSLFGMTYMLAFPMNGHEIHFGFRDTDLIVQARVRGTILEYIPPAIFGDLQNFDLPGPLIANCVHWLDLNSGIMEVRRRPDIWKSKSSHWCVSIRSREAWRQKRYNRPGSLLIDPHSGLFQLVAQVFDHFEYRHGLTVFQPPKGHLSVELRRLELSFTVNLGGLLQCRQLQAEVDPNQDAGTWYGLESKLILRDVSNPSRRIILVPMGEIHTIRNGAHVAIRVENQGIYGRFTINDVLGRIDCPSELWQLYHKALLHACTSFVLPDPLTWRTGTEEAMHCLRSASCQPWTTLNLTQVRTLEAISRLIPKRTYYPSGLKTMQQVTWNRNLTPTIQNDGLWHAIENILRKAKVLASFSLQEESEMLNIEPPSNSFLLNRACWRRHLYQRADSGFPQLDSPVDLQYEARDKFVHGQSRVNVFECVTMISRWSSDMCASMDLADIFQTWTTIGGFNLSFDKFLLSDLLDVEFSMLWGPLVNFCRTVGSNDRYHLMFIFGTMSFKADVNMDIIRTLLSFAVIEDLKALDPPQWPNYAHFSFQQLPTIPYLKQLIKPFSTQYKGDERRLFNLSNKTRRRLERLQHEHESQVENECTLIAECLIKQWPCREPNTNSIPSTLLVDVPGALAAVRPEWLRLFQNMELSDYLEKVQVILNQHRAPGRFRPPLNHSDIYQLIDPKYRGSVIPTLSDNLFCQDFPGVPEHALLMPLSRPRTETGPTTSGKSQSPQMNETGPYILKEIGCSSESLIEINELTDIVRRFEISDSMVQKRYCLDMMQSIQALKSCAISRKPGNEGSTEMQACKPDFLRNKVHELFDKINQILERLDRRSTWLKEGGLWPCVTPVTLLEQLRSCSTVRFGNHMKEILTAFAVSIVDLQRILRIEDARFKQNHQRWVDEKNNVPHVNWDPLKHPDWVLLEIEADISIRPDQVDVALAAELADTTRLVRLVVPKALLTQTAQLLHARLGGLVGREIRHVPFSRKTPTNPDMIKQYFDIHREIQHKSGVIITLPEHILSFKLSGLQRLSDSRIAEANAMIKVQGWMQRTCRDVLDECDFTLATRTQLIYPSGSQTAVDGNPFRWETAQELLRLVAGHLWNLQRDFPQSIEVIPRPTKGGFPVVYFLRRDAEDELITRLVKDIMKGQTSILPINNYNPQDRLAIRLFISNVHVQRAITETIGKIFPGNSAARKNIYLLRGLFVHRILLLTLKKRWNVQYGLHPNRDPIAVPFIAKGVPSEQAEWGHPDVAILFTCLAFYFGGLAQAQLRQNFEHLVKSDDPSSEYDRWTHSSDTLPDILREWSVIETDDEAQLNELWTHLRYQTVVIDYFLNHFVFPKHAKQFQVKLQASGWDIPLFSVGGQTSALTSGFSGTNDNRTLLPLNIKQRDLPMLSHTNAEVLTYLLQPRNRTYVVAADSTTGKRLSETELLKSLCEKKIRMLIDSGAQILEMDNQSLAKVWLQIDHEAPAVLYFDSDNKPFILYRNGSGTPLLASPYADNLADCLVYLDEAHTRGTDLKMPTAAVAALTLGLGQTKDHTVQAAMRLRQLATTQSVVFFAPPEVHQSILDLQGKQNGDHVDSNDVVCWLLKQTCMGIEQMQPLYYSQGMDFCRRVQTGVDNPQFLANSAQRRAYCSVLRQNEKQTLEELYKPASKVKAAKSGTSYATEIAEFVKDLGRRRKDFQDFGGAVHGSALQEVEQEREVAFEVEAVREVQKPVHYVALSFPGLHPDIVNFATTGRLSGFKGFQQAFIALQDTALGKKHGITLQATLSKLFFSKEFMRTVKLPPGCSNDSFLRPVNWVIWSFESEAAMVVIPEEAELLIPMFRESKTHCTHLATYAAPITRKMLHFNSLNYFAMPSLPSGWKPPKWLTIQLGILSGRVYFEFNEYEELCQYLGVTAANEGLDDSLDIPISPAPSRFPNAHEVDIMEASSRTAKKSSFTAKPLVFLQEWLSLKRRGQEFTHTPMGYVCQGKPLHEDHPFFSRSQPDDSSRVKASRTYRGSGKAIPASNEIDEDFDSELEDENDGYLGVEDYGGSGADDDGSDTTSEGEN
ncbi:hypothetical protein CPC735_020410 [Coccidioides posadasii C735 delta SOWgp]|uniref:ubiquitinyl hydrolase 1 n=1 Tax=Coccidioides posadasii (strain C735) TaxID=222929 RepID=C5PJ64_COCP7|nr:hypothetical protein CPC735_020410 [Coccidioides posadasii C735 delta SOWgp]EER23013.1 hypothetical protein CPC735_020410 [Coccidioides posadasii C735 delta SOWgp]|eukprot:XP_003065158.1 hypothetical protein CPC735_020410 [Coccidioides posadasii C735 delta SOWgp]